MSAEKQAEATALQLIEAAKRAGAESADAVSISGRDLSVSVREGALEEAESAESADYGLRVMIGQRQACVSGSDPDRNAIEECAARAVAMARAAPEDPWCGLPIPGFWLISAPSLILIWMIPPARRRPKRSKSWRCAQKRRRRRLRASAR